MRSTGSPERWTRAKTTTDTPRPTMAAWPRRRKRKGSASGLHVGVADPNEVVGTDLEALHLLRHAGELLELPEEDPHRFVVQSLERLGGQLLALLRVEGLVVV